jgi:zinc protease
MSRVRARALAVPAIGLLALAALMISTGGCGGVLGEGSGAPQVDIAFEKYELPNGLEVILRKDSRLPVVSVNVWYHVGPAKEAEGRTGFAHLFEHMMFQGSAHVGSDMHFRYLEEAGASFVNGTTSLDRTNYMEDLPSNQLELALWLESDRMGFLLDRLDQTMLSNQQDVVRNERRQSTENAPYGLGEEAVAHQLFPPGHPYYASVIGSHDDIQAARLEDVREFFTNYYTPNNATLAVVGDIDIDSTRAMIAKYFGSIPKGPEVSPVEVVTPPITAERRLTMTDQVELPRVYLSWLTPTFYAPGDAEADMTGNILGGGKASRLYKSLVYEKKIAQDVSASQRSSGLTSVFEITATAQRGHTLEELEAAIQVELDALSASGPTVEEVKATRTVILTQMLTHIEGLGALADLLNHYNHYTGDPDYLNKDLKRYEAVTPDGIRKFVATHLGRNQRSVVQVLPGEKLLPPSPPTPPPPALTDTVIVSREPWRKQVPAAAAASTQPLPVATRFELANGLTVYLVESNVLPIVTAQLAVRAGSSSDPEDAPGLAGFTLAMLDEGTEQRDALAIARELEALGTGLGSDMGRDGCTLNMRMLKGNAAPALGMLAEMVLSPSFPAAEIERVRNERLTSLLQDRDNPSRTASKIMWRDTYGPQHPYGHMVIGTEATLKRLGRDDVQKLYQTWFRPDNAALILTGNLKEAQARRLAIAAFGGWRKTAGPVPAPAVAIAPAAERVLIADKPGTPQTTLMVVQLGVQRSDPDHEQLTVMNQVLGGLFSSRLNLNLREQHGYTYGAFSSLPENRLQGPYYMGADVRGDVTGAAVREIMKEASGMLTSPVTADELRLAKESVSRTLPAYFMTTASTAATFGQLYLLGLPPDYYQGLPGRIASITPEDISRVTKEHLRPGDMKVIAVGDRARIEPQLSALKLGTIGYRNLDGEPVAGSDKVKLPLP